MGTNVAIARSYQLTKLDSPLDVQQKVNSLKRMMQAGAATPAAATRGGVRARADGRVALQTGAMGAYGE
jgi:hypothetical protein